MYQSKLLLIVLKILQTLRRKKSSKFKFLNQEEEGQVINKLPNKSHKFQPTSKIIIKIILHIDYKFNQTPKTTIEDVKEEIWLFIQKIAMLMKINMKMIHLMTAIVSFIISLLEFKIRHNQTKEEIEINRAEEGEEDREI